MISQQLEKIKAWLKKHPRDLYVAWLIFLAAVTSSGLGRMAVLWPDKRPLTIERVSDGSVRAGLNATIDTTHQKPQPAYTAVRNAPAHGKYVASKNGTSYHYPWCGGASRIKDENKIWFDSKEAAEKAGYKPAGNCPGL